MHARPSPLLLGSVFVGAGVAIVLLALGVIPSDPEQMHAPAWAIALFGGLFVFAGVAVVAEGIPSVQSAAGGLIWLGVGVMFGWVALFGGAEQFSRSAWLPRALDLALARVLFGAIGAGALAVFVLHVTRRLRGGLDQRPDDGEPDDRDRPRD